MLGENEIGIIGDDSIKWLTVTQERFNSKLLQAEQPDIYAKYTTKSSHRRFSIKPATKTDEISNNQQKLQQLLGEAG